MERFILRTEIQTARETVVSYGYDLTPSSVFVVTDWHAPLDAQVTVRLSFPRALGPVDVVARVVEHRVAGAPGEPGGLLLAFDPDVPRTALNALLAEVEALHDAPQPRAAYRVLLVEDNTLTRDVFTYSAGRYFGSPGSVLVDHAESAERAWQLLAAGGYDVVIVDYFLPTADGASLIARLRADERLRGTPIVAISVGGRAAREATMSAGADLFVDKPLVFRDLFNTLQILAHSPAAPTSGAKRTILVLDDSPLALAVTRAALESAGFTVVIAEDLTAFERERARCQPDLILVDVQMPEAYGDDIVATLLGAKVVDVPVVLFSSIEEPELARRTQEASATGYICKAAGMTELVRRCKEYLGRAA
jgi:CheY-like chemotaxis protein